MKRPLLAAVAASMLIHAALLVLVPPAGAHSPALDTNDAVVFHFTPGTRHAGVPAPVAAATRPADRRASIHQERLPSPEAIATTRDADHAVSEDAAAAETGGGAARNAFLALLAARKTYPIRARDKGIEGNVGVRVDLDREGRARLVEVRRSSGSVLLDTAALELVKSSLPFRHGLGADFSADIVIGYRLTD